jgi:hypothetical protein
LACCIDLPVRSWWSWSFTLSESLAVKNEPDAPSIEAISLADKAETGRRHLIAKQCRLLDPSKQWLHDDHGLGRKEPNMMIMGVDCRPSFQTMAFFVEKTGECGELELTTLRSEWRSALKKDLTGPTLLEMSGKR